MMDMIGLTSVVASFALGMAAALLVRGRGKLTSARDMKMVLVVRSDLALGRNAAAALCSQAAISCYKRALSDAAHHLRQWDQQGQTKVVLRTQGEADILQLAETAHGVGLMAEFATDSAVKRPAVLGIGPGPVKLVDQVAGHLKLF